MTTTMQEYKERIEDAACILLKDTSPADEEVERVVAGLVTIVDKVIQPGFSDAISYSDGKEICGRVSRNIMIRRSITENFEPAYMGNYV